MTRPELRHGDVFVVKIGTASLTDAAGRPQRRRLASLCDGVAALHRRGIHVVVVSSGAIAAGLSPLGMASRPTDIPSLQAAAAVGQGVLLGQYRDLFARRGITTAQMLLTRFDFMHRQQYLNARNTLERLLGLGVVPVVNENDTVAVDEIRFGDNDRLAALVANLARARLLALLTDARGVHRTDPRVDPDADIIPEIDRITPELERAAGGRGSQLGSGGMASKITAAWVATFSGVGVVVGDASEPEVLERVAAGETIGSFFHPRPQRLSARRLWLAFAQPPKGTVVIDEGARSALVSGNRSLLPVGVVDVRGEFGESDAVDVVSAGGTLVARGLVRYASSDLREAAGRPSRDFAGREVIHRDQLVILEEAPTR